MNKKQREQTATTATVFKRYHCVVVVVDGTVILFFGSGVFTSRTHLLSFSFFSAILYGAFDLLVLPFICICLLFSLCDMLCGALDVNIARLSLDAALISFIGLL